MKKQVSVVIYTSDGNSSLVETAIKQAAGSGVELNVEISDIINGSRYDLYIACIHDKNSLLLGQVLANSDYLTDQMIFIFESNDLLLGSIVAKLGFNNLFLFPDELFKFTTFITEQIENLPDDTAEDYDSYSIETLIGRGKNSREKISLVKKAAENPDINILIYGESGTGKGLLAGAIHKTDTKKTGPFVEVTCTAIPDTLLESELFGHEKGAFTDAKIKKIGLFELAGGGTIFLDEIGDLDIRLQAKLLKVIDKKVFRRIGGTVDIPLKVRIISATNRNLEEMISQKLFRLDLFYRLSVLKIKLDPLRERKSEIVSLAKFMISKYSSQYKKKIVKVEKSVYKFIEDYDWPGNLREFRNVFEMSVLMLEDKTLRLPFLKNFIQILPAQNDAGDFRTGESEINLAFNYNNTNLNSLTRLYAKEMLKLCANNKTRTAKMLNISRPKLDSLLK